MSQAAPALSIGLAVRNGRATVGRCIESVLAQDFGDLELVVVDNASDDGTPEAVSAYARADRRVALTVNDANVGLHANMKRAWERSRGTLFRWISADDWLEPGYIASCVAALRERPDAVGVTTGFTIHLPDGRTRHEEHAGPFPLAQDPAQRFEQMLWFFHAGDAKYDPVYGMYRRSALAHAHPMRPSERCDWLLSAELALMGPILHLPARLAHRVRDYPVGVDHVAFRRRLDPLHGERIRTTPRRMYRELYALAVNADLTDEQLRRCRRALRRFWAQEVARGARLHASDLRHRTLRRA